MKKSGLTALGLLCATIYLFSQDDFRFGFQISPTFSWMQTDVNYINPNGINTGLKLGAFGEYYFGENYAITAGIGFAFNTGGTLKSDFGGIFWNDSGLDPGLDSLPAGANLKYNLQYVEVPLGLKMRTREFGYLRYFAEIPMLTLGFESQARGTVQATGISETEKLQIKNEIKALALSWGLGAGVEYSISQNTAFVGGIYFQKYFSDVNDDNGTIFHNTRGAIADESKATIGSITLRLGVIF